jgi:hypothetical protein
MRRGLIWLVMVVAAVAPAFGAPIQVNLNSATSFGLLGSTISNTGTSSVAGNVGATTTITGFPPATATGTVYPAPSNPTVATAYSDFESAFNAAALLPSTQSLGGLTTSTTFLGNNVYTFTSPNISTATGINLTFNAQSNPNAVFIIRIADALTVNGAMTFTLQNGAQASNIFWIVGTIATISVGSSGAITFDGNVLAGQSFTMSAATGGSGVLAGTINGCVFAETANTLAGETDVEGCSSTTASGITPEPGSAGLMSFGLLLGILAWRKLRVSF